ncbi:MAG: regulatory iron-sulfur-containing complex subunit RicT, partial [Bacteroidota bacterium]
MGCSTCSTSNSTVKGCRSNGGCGTGGCNKMNVFDWLSNMEFPSLNTFDIVEVKFKNGRKDFFRNTKDLSLTTGDPVVVDVTNGYHIGYISLQGELVRLQMQKKKVPNNDQIRAIYRVATDQDLEKLEKVRNREMPTMYRTREIIQKMGLSMKLSDVEYQADNNKATFYYSADSRVDFRELIKVLAGEFRIRIEMRQISLRQEAGRIGGIGSCGRELCCSTWLSDFSAVNTAAARYQNIAINQVKLSGQCGRLKCCLNYELDTYMEALEAFPKKADKLRTEAGLCLLIKTDIFKGIMYYTYKENRGSLVPLPVARVHEILELNRAGEKPADLKGFQLVIEEKEEDLFGYEDVTGAVELPAEKRRKKRRKKKKPSGERSSSGRGGQAKGNAPAKTESGDAKKPSRRQNNRRKRGG